MNRRARTRGEQAVHWVEEFCYAQGRPVRLSAEERAVCYTVYDGGRLEPIGGRLAAFLTLFHLCGYAATDEALPQPVCLTTIFGVWGACGPELRRVLRRHGDMVSCPDLQKTWRAA